MGQFILSGGNPKIFLYKRGCNAGLNIAELIKTNQKFRKRRNRQKTEKVRERIRRYEQKSQSSPKISRRVLNSGIKT